MRSFFAQRCAIEGACTLTIISATKGKDLGQVSYSLHPAAEGAGGSPYGCFAATHAWKGQLLVDANRSKYCLCSGKYIYPVYAVCVVHRVGRCCNGFRVVRERLFATPSLPGFLEAGNPDVARSLVISRWLDVRQARVDSVLSPSHVLSLIWHDMNGPGVNKD